jgi:hypothetical protein
MRLKRKRNIPIQDRVNDKIQISDTGCWLWTDSLVTGGYGGITINKKRYRATHIVYKLYKNIDIPEGKMLCHTCDNPACVNPDHLFIGNQIDNLRDMRLKNRHAFGSGNGTAKLSEKIVPIIREANKAGFSVASIARYFRMNSSVISKVVNTKTWRHVR